MRIKRVTVLSLMLLCSLLGGCIFNAPPGEGARAEQGYASAVPIISALRHFRANRGGYPEALDELVPDYLASDRMLVASIKDARRPFEYRRVDDEYELSFGYAGAGPTNCHYRPSTDWRCVGAS